MKRLLALGTVLLLVLAGGAWAAMEIPDDVKELFQKKCAGCHKGNHPPKGLNLEPAKAAAILDAASKEVPTLKIIDTDSPGSSYLLKKVRRQKDIPGKGMPPSKPLAAGELQVIESWLAGVKKSFVAGGDLSSGGFFERFRIGFNIFRTF